MADEAEAITGFLSEKVVTPNELATRKTAIHRAFIETHWGRKKLEQTWTVREACIAALAG